MANIPVDFEAKARGAKSASGGGYPVQISAADLMRNFVHAALEVDESLIESASGSGGHPGRKLKIPAIPTGESPLALTATGGSLSWAAAGGIPTPPGGGTHVLGAVDGVLQWIATEEC
jgi:hypothetical protein